MVGFELGKEVEKDVFRLVSSVGRRNENFQNYKVLSTLWDYFAIPQRISLLLLLKARLLFTFTYGLFLSISHQNVLKIIVKSILLSLTWKKNWNIKKYKVGTGRSTVSLNPQTGGDKERGRVQIESVCYFGLNTELCQSQNIFWCACIRIILPNCF